MINIYPWIINDFYIQIFAAMLLFMIVLPKQKNFVFKIIISFVLYAVISYLFLSLCMYINFMWPYFIVLLLMLIAVNKVCLNISIVNSSFFILVSYAIQNSAYHITSILFTLFNLSREVWFEPFVTIAIFAAVYTFVYFFLVKKMKVDEMIEIPKTRLIIISAIILALEYALNLASFTVQNTIYLEIALFACAVLTIIIQFNVFNQEQLENQCDQIEQLLQKEKAQYNQSKTNIETLNRVCHDLKHQMTALKNNPENDFTNEAENAVLIYDSTAHTGNEALDIVLTEKNLFCIKNDIQFTYIADGKLLNFIKATDIYSIFGNALSNAIECVMKEADTDKRLISLNIYNKDKLLYIDCENYTPSDKSFENVIPKTDKPDADYHGFGLKSIKYITEKYGGTMSICQWEHFFNLKLVYPMPNE